MFNRRLYKQQAREALKGRWKIPVIVAALTGTILACLSRPVASSAETEIHIHFHSFSSSSSVPLLLYLVILAATGILRVATSSLYLRLLRTNRPATFGTFLEGFDHWLHAALGAWWFTLWTHLWALLFFIPGIVKAFSYSQMFFILAEHKNISATKAMTLSKIMTQGHKADLFVMYLSFFGWAILASIPCGLGWLWLCPYMHMSGAICYKALKTEALASGKLCPADFA
ncbi:MAG: DUF975 family protein [Treponema sp.]|nr:DUF975 family protein [Treponema sp.]